MMGHLSPPPSTTPKTHDIIFHSTFYHLLCIFHGYSKHDDDGLLLNIHICSIIIFLYLFIYVFFLSLRVCTSKDRNTTWWKSAFYFSFFFCIAWPRNKNIKWHIFRCTSQWMISLNWQCLQNKSKSNKYK
jgi:hypothetical protein